MKRHYGMAGSRRDGAALIITLAFIILLTVILVIFFTQALSYRQQSNGSFNDFKSATIGQSGLETVVGDLMQEMTNGSSSMLYSSGTTITYAVTNNANAVPRRSGTNYVGGVDTTPNLVRVSIRSDTIAFPGVGSRASADSSTNVVAAGQYISMARWNKHYLLPRGTSSSGVVLAGTTNVDTTPTNSFYPPDWVYVTREEGPVALTSPFKDYKSTAVTPIGRYAYAIYDEGGLLDANVAGVPSNVVTNAAYSTTSGANTSLLVWGSGNKGSEAFADLTVTNAMTQAPILTQPQIDQLVGWRNNATIQPSGAFISSVGNPLTTSGYTYTAAKALAYHDAMVLNTNGFLVTSGASYNDLISGKLDTDQVFISRQALISFFLSAGLPQDSLQYFGTFTRALEQPNYNPPVGRPMVQSSTNSNAAVFGTGNDAYQKDRVTTTPTTNAPSDVNPPFLAVRATTGGWQRYDGSTAVMGEPLIKERFPLSLLTNFPTGEVAPAGTTTDPTTQAGRIYKYFGLTYQSAGLWYYNHDSNNTTGIDRLSPPPSATTVGVTLLSREPDFFELLKAAINVGSIAKGSAYGQDNSGVLSPNTGVSTYTSAGSVGYLAQAHDTLSNLQILQIGANIIDQSKADDFPTRIQFSGDANVPPNIVCGSQDLPYIYRARNWLDQSSSTNFVYFIQPELWDPYSYNGVTYATASATAAAASGVGASAFVSPANTPKIFRVRLEPDPTAVSVPIGISVDYEYQEVKGQMVYDDWQSQATVSLNSTNYQSSTSSAPNPVPISFEAGEQNGFWGFREPTLLAGPTLNPSVNLNGVASTASGKAAALYTDYNTGLQMTGFLMIAPFVTTQVQPLSYTGIETLAKINLAPNYSTPTPNTVQPTCLRMYLDYQDPHSSGSSSTNWITYDQKTFASQNGASSYDATPSHFQLTQNKTYAGMLSYFDFFYWTCTDPRSQRWATAYTEYATYLTTLNAANNEFGSQRVNGGIAMGNHLGSRTDLGFHMYGAYTASGVQEYKGYETEYAAENNVFATYQSDTGDTGQRFFSDVDGVPRRAMGGYVADSANNGNVLSNVTPEGAVGLPLYVADNISTGAGGQGWASRPTMLHRPFRSVAELGYVFRDSPWANLNFSFPESGDSALLDVFCINDTSSTAGLVAGRVNLNTRQAPVVAALISGSLTDKDNSATGPLSQAMASSIASTLVARTGTGSPTVGYGPLLSRADLVGTWIGPTVSGPVTTANTSGYNLKAAATATTSTSYPPPYPPNPPIWPGYYYSGFSADIGTNTIVTGTPVAMITRQRESVMRGLVDAGTTRTWNLLIDLVAQSGRFPSSATSFTNFVVEGEKHYWLHVAIDRYTGKILDSQLEVVKE